MLARLRRCATLPIPIHGRRRVGPDGKSGGQRDRDADDRPAAGGFWFAVL